MASTREEILALAVIILLVLSLGARQSEHLSQLLLNDNTLRNSPLNLSEATMAVKRTDDRWRLMEESLGQFSYRYYMYTDPNVTQEHNLLNGQRDPTMKRRFSMGAEYENAILNVLRNHSLRTDDRHAADIFIVTSPIGDIIISRRASFDQAFAALISTPTFQENSGHRHVIVSGTNVGFDAPNNNNIRSLSKWYLKLANVSICMGYDAFAAQNISRTKAARKEVYDYKPYFDKIKPVTRYSFSIGIGDGHSTLPYVPATMEKFARSSLLVFYRSRRSGSLYNSTRFRHSPFDAPVEDAYSLPASSIGNDLPPDRWTRDFLDSKFCLVIRGDSPHSHALFHSIRVGCIPVLVSDFYPEYSPMFKSTLNLMDFCIVLDEKRFVADPVREMKRLHDISRNESYIEEKLRALKFAQRCVMHDIHNSLFVPAFVKEAMASMGLLAPLKQ